MQDELTKLIEQLTQTIINEQAAIFRSTELIKSAANQREALVAALNMAKKEEKAQDLPL